MKSYLLILIFLTLLLSTMHGQKDLSKINIDAYYDSLRTEMIGKELPNVVFTDSLGNNFDLHSLKGKMVAINIWGFGCKPCIEEMPKLNELVNQYGKSVKFISLLGGGMITFDCDLKSRLNKFNFKYTTLSTNKNVLDEYGLFMILPTHIILDKSGKVLDIILGSDVVKVKNTIESNLH
jgi:thiol-disulfide isomerase/thioredoxin